MSKIHGLASIAAMTTFLALLGIQWAVVEGPLRNPQEALKDFYEAKDRTEDQLMDPLILAGADVVPLVIEAISNKGMNLRRYAIGFLGNGRYVEALPTLESILKDETEIDYFRSDTLMAIHQISPAHAKEIAPQFLDGPEILKEVAQAINSGKLEIGYERSFGDAFWHRHCR